MYRELPGNRYWGVVVGEFAGGDFFYKKIIYFIIYEFDYTHRSTGLYRPQTS